MQGTVQGSKSAAQDDGIWARSGVRERLFVSGGCPGEQFRDGTDSITIHTLGRCRLDQIGGSLDRACAPMDLAL